jgi:hypothetical protein
MHAKMEKIMELLKMKDSNEDSFYIIEDNDNFQSFDYMDFACFSMNVENPKETKVCISFYSNCDPWMSANIIRHLMRNKFNSFEICENMYLEFNDEGICTETYFGIEADEKYKEDIYEEIRDKKLSTLNLKKKKETKKEEVKKDEKPIEIEDKK